MHGLDLNQRPLGYEPKEAGADLAEHQGFPKPDASSGHRAGIRVRAYPLPLHQADSQSGGAAPTMTAGGPAPQSALAAMLTVRARRATLKANETTAWAVTVRRTGLFVIATSETCEVMPITNEKYTKSQ
jgi:hypothetical protein